MLALMLVDGIGLSHSISINEDLSFGAMKFTEVLLFCQSIQEKSRQIRVS